MLEKRGLIEGFYGIPRSFEERMSMIGFLSDIDMNQYVYAPKDDPYHNVKWREPYPDEKLAEISELASLSKNKGVDFVWAIHPGQNLIDFNLYEEEIDKLFTKYDSLHKAGVTSFALCMDDIDRDLAYEQREFHLRLVKDILKKLKSYENEKLLFVHPWYNSAWIDEKGEEYFKLFRNLDNLEIMWTGYDVVVPITKTSQERFTEISQKEANIWFNWPVNDYLRDRIFMEIFEFYDSSEINYKSILTNPMNQAELSKISIYQIGEFAKDPAGFVPIESFKRALGYIDEKVASELFIIADSFFASGVYDRFEDKKYREDYEIGLAYRQKDFEKVKSLIDKKLVAIDSYFKNRTNDKLYMEVKPFFTSLSYLLAAVKAAIDKDFKKASSLYEKCGECKVKIYKEFSLDTIEYRKVKTSRVLMKIYEELMEEVEK
ncbi:O-GlcNAcase BT_4395 precursor [Anaerococcus prevotii]|uniref:Hyaluronidase n=1 Tax=Anaerococcus prevotii (strain ATCC 9321 / DSM 20548 / JCM 6508 / NCTC 11806 / PC1) TaxID=525919 RepID=C7RFD9_ANAPD|nr:beta-N-acetylglucosaminidase domain-containing protein [Anaerococcus prevotii]ACV28200.1 Hyaluronidase [Anaerococcus prevotii DSM 20548]SUU93754.1 O-GlcNAcase BT_4395 precursor [Anaerococcus prevotii]